MMNRIGIDLGGTKIEGLVLAPDGAELARTRVATPREDYPGTIAAIVRLVESLERDTGARASLGIGMPGAVSPLTGLVKNANSTWLIGQPFDRDLEGALGRPVRVENDANCLAVSDASDGAGAGLNTVFAVILGTGVGGGIAVHGRVLTGRNAIAGEWGHNQLPWQQDDERPGPACYCGKAGCIETFLSGPGMARDHQRITGQGLTGPEIIAAAAAGDTAAAATFERFRSRLARALAGVVNILDPDAIVLGGGVSNVDALYDGLPELMSPWCFSDGVSTPILKAKHGDSSGVRGAAWLWRADESAGLGA